MSKLYVFGIGGTGARVMRSLTMLLAAGVDCGVDTIVPIIIDRDVANHDLSRTQLLIEDYITVNRIAETNGKNRFFKTKIKLLGNKLILQLKDNTAKFESFIGVNTMTNENKALVNMLFSKATLDLEMEVGFQGNPNIGSIVLNQFDNSDVFRLFAEDFQDGDKIFIISSIFGGTGASGFPLLRKTLQTPNVHGSDNKPLPNWGLVNKAKIGAITVLPYFNVATPDDNSQVNSDTFIDKARAALSYYKTEDKKIDTLYYIADKEPKTYSHSKGGDTQKNNAHMVEFAAAMAMLDFVDINNAAQNFNRNNNDEILNTTYKEFGIMQNTKSITFNDLADQTKRLIVNPLSRFLLFAKYMGYRAVEVNVNQKRELVAKKTERDDIFRKEHKYQPYARKRFLNDFRNRDAIQKLESVQKKFVEWLIELQDQERKFQPFNLVTPNATDFVKGMEIMKNSSAGCSNWAMVDNELNRQVASKKEELEDENYFIELFFRATEDLINFKN